jgi:hypothetical protein
MSIADLPEEATRHAGVRHADYVRHVWTGGEKPVTLMRPSRSKPAGSMLPIFRIRLRNGGSIGPGPLRRVWSLALGSQNVSVSRNEGRLGRAPAYQTYIVSAIAVPSDMKSLETTLRRLLQDHLSVAHIELTSMI